MIGNSLTHYRITAKLGEGGMGEVYRASDTKLGREVAIKVLPARISRDATSLARFEREAKALASLNHPHIASIYGFDAERETHFLVLELVEGQTLSERLRRGRLPLDEALRVARQIAEAVEAAHAKGIIHRDLKPGNIKLTPEGRVKVLDFGLAKMEASVRGLGTSASDPEAPTLKAETTVAGAVMGTPAYMSPEQARGLEVDKRTDVWAFGCCLFECLAGSKPFRGETVTDMMSEVLKSEPDWSALPAEVPRDVATLLRRCLEKDPRRRLSSLGDIAILLEDSTQSRQPGPTTPTASSISGSNQTEAVTALGTLPTSRLSGWRDRIWMIAFGVALLGLIVLAIPMVRQPRETPAQVPLRRFAIMVPSKAAPNWSNFQVTISPDGAQIAYPAREGNTVNLCVRALDSLIARRVADGREAQDWFFSRDGEWLGIADGVGLSKVSIRGGGPQIIYRWGDTEKVENGFSWGPDDYILFGAASGIQRVPASGGSPEVVTRIDPGTGVKAHLEPSHMPDGRSALITIVRADGSESAGLVDLKDGSVRDLGIRGHGFVYLAPGWLAFKQGNGTTVFAVAFDPANPARGANPVPVLENVLSMRVARDGTLVYIPTRGESTARLVWVDRDGQPTAVGTERLDYNHLDLAPDGRRALLNLEDGAIDLIDLQGGTRKLVANGMFPIWSPNGERVTFTGAVGLQWVPADGSAPPEMLVPYAGQPGYVVPTSWNVVTGELAYYDHRAFEIWIRSTDGKTRRFLGGPGRKRSGRFSPDGKWMAFVSDETGECQVYVTAYPGPGPTVAVSVKGGLSPIWSADCQELFFRLGSKVLAARMSSAQSLGFSAPVELFDGPYTLDLLGHQREDVTSDGRRFLMVENSDDFPIVIVQNWPLELGRLVR